MAWPAFEALALGVFAVFWLPDFSTRIRRARPPFTACRSVIPQQCSVRDRTYPFHSCQPPRLRISPSASTTRGSRQQRLDPRFLFCSFLQTVHVLVCTGKFPAPFSFGTSVLAGLTPFGRICLRLTSMSPRTRYWILHWLDALTWPASLILKGIGAVAQVARRMMKQLA
jgi:hypothetical protein